MADQTEQKIAAYLRDLLTRGPEQAPQPQRQLEQKQEQEQDLKPQRGLSP